MPELPEVETVKLGLQKLLPGAQVVGVTFDIDKSFPNTLADVERFLVGATIVALKRRAKVLLIELSSKYSLLIHLKMTGQLVYIKSRGQRAEGKEKRFGAGHPNDSLIGRLPDKSTRVTLDLGDAKLYFNDQRKFGWIKLIPTAEVSSIDFMKKLGPEPLASDFSAEDFRARLLRRPNANIKATLLDQTVVAGIGNIYADEGLWAAKIHPSTLVKNVSKAKLDILFRELQAVLRLSIEKGGSSDRNYTGKGSYISFAKVFRKENTACPRCGTTIIKTRVAGRGTHICPYCQKAPK